MARRGQYRFESDLAHQFDSNNKQNPIMIQTMRLPFKDDPRLLIKRLVMAGSIKLPTAQPPFKIVKNPKLPKADRDAIKEMTSETKFEETTTLS